jgi:hypothetical protein
LFREKQIPFCVPRPPNCGGEEKARDSVRNDTVNVWPQLVRDYEGKVEGKIKVPAATATETAGRRRYQWQTQIQLRPPKKQAAATNSKTGLVVSGRELR